MSIPMSFAVDIAGKEVLTLKAVVEELKFVEEKGNIFADFPIGATIQDGGKRKRSDGHNMLELLHFIFILFYFYLFSFSFIFWMTKRHVTMFT